MLFMEYDFEVVDIFVKWNIIANYILRTCNTTSDLDINKLFLNSYLCNVVVGILLLTND